MKGYELLDAIGGINAKHIHSAEQGQKQKKTWIRWVAVTACLCLIIAGAVTVIPRLHKPASSQSISSVAALQQLGFDAEVVKGPVNVSSYEMPYVDRDELVKILETSTIVDCTVEEINRIKVQAPDSNSVWYITTMTLSLNDIIHGDIAEDHFRVVSAAVTNTPVEFLSSPAIQDCREQMHAAFILKKTEGEVWTIGSTDVDVKELGDYSVAWCLIHEGDTLQFQNYDIKLSEID